MIDWARASVPVAWAGSVDDGTAFGVDASAIPDLSTGTQATRYVSLGEALYRRLTSPRGSLFYDPDYGFDVRQWINQHGAPRTLYAMLGTLIAQECEKDPRVIAATVEVRQFDLRSGTIRVTCELADELVRYVLGWTASGDPTWRMEEGGPLR